MRNMKRLALSALVLLIPALVWADEKETMLHALGQFEQAWRSTTPCEVSSNACQTREIWLAQRAAHAADQYLNTPDAKERHSRDWRLVAHSVIKYSQVRTEAYTAYVHARNRNPGAAKTAVPFNRLSVGAGIHSATESHPAKRRKFPRDCTAFWTGRFLT
jgi:hypothetical protein